MNVLLNGEHIPATNGSNYAYFNNPEFNKQMDDAAKLSGQERFTTYGNIATAIMQQQAPWAAWDVDNNIDFFAPRIGCTVYNPGLRDGTEHHVRQVVDQVGPRSARSGIRRKAPGTAGTPILTTR